MLAQRISLARAPVLISIAILIVVVTNLMAWLHWDSTLIMDDGVQYLSTATNWLQGNGFSTNALIYEPHFQNVLPAPQTVWPPGLPLLQALVTSTGIELISAALIINLLANLLSALMVYLILRRCGTGSQFAILCAIIYLLTTQSWMLAVALASEPLFIVLVLTAVYCLPTTAEGQYNRWILAGLLIAASICTRYSGVFAAASVVMACLFILLIRVRRNGSVSLLPGIKGLALFCIFPASAFLLLLFRTQQLSGTVERRTGNIDSKTVADTFFGFAQEMSVLTGFRDGLIFRNDVDTWMFVFFTIFIMLAVGVAVFVLINDRSTNNATDVKTHLSFRWMMIAVMMAHAFAFCGYLVYSSLSDTALNITTRYLYQIYPGIFIVVCALVAIVFERGSSLLLSGYRWVIGALVCLYVVAQINLIPVTREFAIRGADSRAIVDLQVSDGIVLADVVESCVGQPIAPDKPNYTSLWSNDAVLLHLNTGTNTISLPSTYTTNQFDFQRWKADIETYQIRLFIFINREQSISGPYGAMLADIKLWLRNNEYPVLEMQQNKLESGASVDVYLADSQCADKLRP